MVTGDSELLRGGAATGERPLWELENVIVSSHLTDNVPGQTNELQAELFCDNLRRYLDGEPLVNELDKKLLY